VTQRFRTISQYAGKVPGPTCDGCQVSVEPMLQYNAGPEGTRIVLQFPPGWRGVVPFDEQSTLSLSHFVCPECARKVDRGEEFERD
jgi:hypothetical protein